MHSFCSFFIGHAFHINQSENSTVIWWERRKASLDRALQLSGFILFFEPSRGIRKPVIRLDLFSIRIEEFERQCRLPAFPPEFVIAGIDHNTRQPAAQ